MNIPDPSWNPLRAAGADLIAPDLAGRVLAEAARQRAEARRNRENLRLIACAGCVLAILSLAYTAYGPRKSEAESLAAWNQTATWVGTFASNN